MSSVNFEKLLYDFEPNFEFGPPKAIPQEEFHSRIEQLRQTAAHRGHDVLLIHADGAKSFKTTNMYLRYACDWAREGVLIIPTDRSKGLQLISFFTQSVVLPPPGEPIGIEKLWQVGALGQEFSGRSGTSEVQLVEAIYTVLSDLGYNSASVGVIGDNSSTQYWEALTNKLPKLKTVDETQIVIDMQTIRSKNEQDLIRASAQLMDIGFQAACHVSKPEVTDFEIYAAFTFAQMARGGESGDGYQIGINRFGTHCGKPYGHKVAPGDLINLYMSALPYHGYTAQAARMIAVGDITSKQEETLEVCTEAIRRAETMIRPGARFCDLHKAAFSVYIEHGYLTDDTTATMPYNWAPNDDLSAREIPIQYVQNKDYERYGRKLTHVYPPVAGPHNPNLGHSVGMSGNPKFNITSHNTDIMKPGMVFVLHAQWLDPLNSGANIGNCYLVTENGFENLSCHTPLDTIRIKA